jgi:hypothetical protein
MNKQVMSIGCRHLDKEAWEDARHYWLASGLVRYSLRQAYARMANDKKQDIDQRLIAIYLFNYQSQRAIA